MAQREISVNEQEIYVEVTKEEFSKPRFPFLKILKSFWWVLIVVTLICGIIGTCYGFLIKKPTYTASCSVIIKLSLDDESGYSNEQVVSNNTTLAKNYLRTINDVINSPKTAVRAKSYNDYAITSKNIGASYSKESLIVTISYTDLDESTVQGKLKDVIRASEEELMQEKILVATDIKLQELDKYSVTKNDNRAVFPIVGVGAGLVLGFGVAVVIYYAKKEKKSEK